MRKFLIYMIILLATNSCIESFTPDIDISTSTIVVSGSITDASPAKVNISKTVYRITKQRNVEYVGGARVFVIDDLGNEEQLVEQKRGFYYGNTSGVVGRSYYVKIQLADTREITSSPQVLKAGPSIDCISIEPYQYYRRFGTVRVDISGLNLNLEMDNADTLARYYKWEIGGTYKRYTAFDPQQLEPPCYVTLPQNYYFVLGESLSNTKNILSKTLKFIEPDGTFKEGQSVLVTQYNLSEETYDYWRKIEEQRNSVGSVFDPPPAQIVGNLTYTNSSEEPALGFFQVSGEKKKRIFITPSDFPGLTESSPEFSTADLNSACFPPIGWVGVFIPPKYCEDCSLLNNSTKIKPSYWPE